jgi:hypothetical protein
MTSIIDTLGKAARHGMFVRVTCRACAMINNKLDKNNSNTL